MSDSAASPANFNMVATTYNKLVNILRRKVAQGDLDDDQCNVMFAAFHKPLVASGHCDNEGVFLHSLIPDDTAVFSEAVTHFKEKILELRPQWSDYLEKQLATGTTASRKMT